MQVAFGSGDDIGIPAIRNPRGLAPEHDGSNRLPNLKTNQVPALVKGEVPAARIGVGVVLLETITHIVGFTFNGDPNTHPNVVWNFATIWFERRNDLDHALALEHAAFLSRTRHKRYVFDARWRIQQAITWDC